MTNPRTEIKTHVLGFFYRIISEVKNLKIREEYTCPLELTHGGTLDYGNTKSPQFDIKCPDQGRGIIHGERTDYELIDIKDNLGNKEIQNLLSECMYMPNEEKLVIVTREYASSENMKVFGCRRDNLTCGIIVLDVTS